MPLHNSRRYETGVGFIAFCVLAALIFISYASNRFEDDSGGAYRILATFNRIDGLGIGDDVQLAGIPIGEVESFTLDANYRARVTLQINRDIELPLDTAAAIHTDGLFGTKFVVLEPGGELETLQNGDEISYTQDSLIIGELLDLIIAEGRATRGLPPLPDGKVEE
jgi:phospholipid/cholesterol/gamma-HCH transport system substrate-binding protein